MEVRHYVTTSGRDPYQQWLDGLKDLKGRVVIQRRIDRITNGNFGDHRFCQAGVWELRIDYGPGYRVYYARGERRSYFCYVVDQSGLSQLISRKRCVIGVIIVGEDNEESFKISAIP